MTPANQPAGVLLRFVVAFLPARRREWGRAMRAEFANLDDASERWPFVLGCLRATLSQASVGATGRVLASAGSIGAVVALTARTGYPPLRVALIAYVVLLVAVAWAGRLPALASANRPAGWLRLGGVALVGVFATGVVTGLGTGGNPVDRAAAGVPILAAVSCCYLVAVVVSTAGYGRSSGYGSSGNGWSGLAIGAAAGVLWAAAVLVFPPVPTAASAAWLSMLIAAVAAAALALRRTRGPGFAVAPVLAAAATCALVIDVAEGLIATLAPVRFIPLLADGAGPLTPAARIAQSRAELGDHYIAVLFVGALTALGLVVATLLSPRAAAPKAAVEMPETVLR